MKIKMNEILYNKLFHFYTLEMEYVYIGPDGTTILAAYRRHPGGDVDVLRHFPGLQSIETLLDIPVQVELEDNCEQTNSI